MTTAGTAQGAADAHIDQRFVAGFLGDRAALERYEQEVRASRLVEHLERQAEVFWSTVQGVTTRGHRYNTGRVTGRAGYGEGIRLYAILRHLRATVAVETGVCNGVSSAFLLLALERNGGGTLHSIDLPEFTGEEYDAGAFWEGKGGAVVPEGKEPGWMIPEHLRGNWELILGRTQDELPPLLERLRSIDAFVHDSEHSYECMSFEFGHAWRTLRPGGALIADDVNVNAAFAEFAAEQAREPVPLGAKMSFLVK